MHRCAPSDGVRTNGLVGARFIAHVSKVHRHKALPGLSSCEQLANRADAWHTAERSPRTNRRLCEIRNAYNPRRCWAALTFDTCAIYCARVLSPLRRPPYLTAFPVGAARPLPDSTPDATHGASPR